MSTDPTGCRCVLCHDYGDRQDTGRMDLGTVGHVQEHGWSVLMVPADDQGPGFAYTIGLWHSYRSPELAMFGLDIDLMHRLLNTLGGKAAQGETLADGQHHHDIIERHPLALRAADLRWYRTFFGRAIAFYRRPPFPVLQVVWPDRDGHFNWQEQCAEAYRESQPQLWRKPDEHPEGVWTALL